MMAYLIALALALVVLIAYYSAKDGQQIYVGRAVTVFLFLTMAMGWSLYWREVYTKDERFDELWQITHSVAVVANSCGINVEATLQSLRDFEKIWPDTLSTRSE